VSGLEGEEGGDRGVDAAAHRDEGAVGPRLEPGRSVSGGRPEGPVEGVGGQGGGVPAGGREAAEGERDVLGAHPRGLEQQGPLDQLDHRAARRQ
jgi:hypothetical protein